MSLQGTPPLIGARAGFWVRFVAAIIDGFIIGIVAIILTLALHASGDLLAFVVAIAYYTYFEGGPRGAGPGKRAMNIRVCDPRAALRYIAAIISAIPIFLGYFWMLWDGQKQCWHDKIARDIVIPARV
jgi:uncharacterized RDD family membrane protein YckC